MRHKNTIKPLKFADVTPPTITNRRKRCRVLPWAKIIFIGGPLLVVALIAAGVLLQMRQDSNNNMNDVRIVAERVGRHYTLPRDETPALATVTDKQSLQTKFLQQANNGDKILIYQKAKRVIIYRPDTDRIIDVGPVSVAPAQADSQQ